MFTTDFCNKLHFKPQYKELYRCLWREGLKNVKGNTTDRNKVFLEVVGVAYLAIFNNKGGNIMSFKARRMNVAIIKIEDDKVLVAQEDYLERITWMTVPNSFFFPPENEM